MRVHVLFLAALVALAAVSGAPRPRPQLSEIISTEHRSEEHIIKSVEQHVAQVPFKPLPAIVPSAAASGISGRTAFGFAPLSPALPKAAFRILSESRNFDPDGRYFYSFETENGVKAQEEGDVKNESEVAKGAFSYTGDDGKLYSVTYTADENGFHAVGDHLPVAPAIPEAIKRSLEYNAKHDSYY